MNQTITKPIIDIGLKWVFIFLSVYLIPQANAQFWIQDFSNGIPPNWLNDDELNNGIKWEYCSNPTECAPASLPVDFLEEPHFMSKTVFNGYVFVNSNGGEEHISSLITPPINCSFADEKVILYFETHIGFRLTAPNLSAFVRVKNENSDWVTFNFFENLGIWSEADRESCNPERVFIDITDVAAGKSAVEIEWRWSAENDLSWAIDDIALYDFAPYEEDVVWGKKPGLGDFKGGFNDWTHETISGGCDWFWEPVGWVGNSQFTPVPNDLKICARTGNNGAAVIHPDLCFAQTGNLVQARAELISPTIDLSNVTEGEGLILEFEQLFAEGNTISNYQPLTSVMYSIDNGQNWLDTLDCNSRVCFGNANFENSTFRTALPPEVLGTPEFRIKFAFNGQLFFWVIDDVRLKVKKPNDLKLRTDFFAIPPTAKVPASQFQPFGLLVDVENVGNEPQPNTRVLAIIENEFEQTVYSDTLWVGNLIPGELIENTPFQNLVDFAPQPGKYKGYYKVESDFLEDFPTDNIIEWNFEITENIFAKEFGPCKGTGFTPTADFKHEIGNAFYVVNADSLVAAEISFQIANPNQIQGKRIFTTFYSWKTENTKGDINEDFLANESEITVLASNEYLVNGDEQGLITIGVNFDETEPCIELEDSTFYFVTLILGNPSANQPLVVAATERLDYNPSFFLNNELKIGQATSFPMLRIGNDTDFDIFGFGLDRIPVVRLHTRKYCGEVATKDILKPNLDLAVYPNPVNGMVFLTLQNEAVQKEILIEIIDESGKIVTSKQIENTIVKQLPINLNYLPTGSYILRLVSENGFGTQKIIKIQ